ncbi:beta-lactamase-like protein [Obelidium mucronatum]|nr:beta-lactamase-like protein [Obelidium mucronatum]
MDITFLGTASAQPSPTRNHSALAFRCDGEVWLVDCGEATQHQLIHLNNNPSLFVSDPEELLSSKPESNHAPKLSKLTNIFLKHLHGDHCFGLPGLLCTAGAVVRLSSNEQDQQPKNTIHIFGPRGVKAYVRNVLDASMSRIGRGIVIHELLLPTDNPSTQTTTTPHIDETEGQDFHALNISSSTATSETAEGWYWNIITGSTDPKSASLSNAKKITVQAAPIQHTVPTVGYFFTEPKIPGKLQAELITPILLRNKAALGLKNPMVLLSKVKAGETLTLPDGTVISPTEFLEPSRRGRRVLILGDTSNAIESTFVGLIDALKVEDAKDASDAAANHQTNAPVVDLVIHEATNSCLKEDIENGSTPETVTEQTRDHGHSTPEMAAQFAKRVGAARLVMNHFSSRYKGDAEPESLVVMEQVRQLAVAHFGERVVCARDFMNVKVHLPK